MATRQEKPTGLASPLFDEVSEFDRTALSEPEFRRLIAIERKRTERSKAPFVLMLLEINAAQAKDKSLRTLAVVTDALLGACRDTDQVGWYEDGAVVGVMFTGLIVSDRNSILTAILNRVSGALRDELSFEQFSQIGITFHFFPDDWEANGDGPQSNTALYPDLVSREKRGRGQLFAKRVIDIVGSSTVLLLCAPLMLLVALLIKVTSRGPVFYRQTRVGQYGRTFTFLKFRSMHANNDAKVHREYVTKLITEQQSGKAAPTGEGGVYKLTNDRRITRIGHFIRRTSIDELPQLLNVLMGDMSLVGPRPPIPYELAAYQTWHRRRLLEVRPGITGLWQVTGRCTVKFDEMVRLDLRYATSWSPWLDIKILLMTPWAVIKGSGAY